MAYAHLVVKGHRLKTNRATTDDKRFEIFARVRPVPLGVGLAQASIAVNQWIVGVIIILCHCFYLQIETLVRLI